MFSIKIKIKKKYGLSGVGGIRTHNFLELEFWSSLQALEKGYLTPELSKGLTFL